ncbi:MAG TPA: DUF948 domain-containing protein [Actinopolymorphaceae bacterium]
MELGAVAGLLAAAALLALVGFLAYPIVKLGKVLDETRHLVRNISEETVPLLEEVTTTVKTTNTELQRVDAITSHVQEISGNVAGLSSLFAATLGRPLVKIAALSYGIRRAIVDRRDADIHRRVRDEMRAERAAAKAGRRTGGRS